MKSSLSESKPFQSCSKGDVCCLMSDIWCLMSDTRRPMSDAWCQMPDLCLFDVRHLMFVVRCHTSQIRSQILDIRRLIYVLIIKCIPNIFYLNCVYLIFLNTYVYSKWISLTLSMIMMTYKTEWRDKKA